MIKFYQINHLTNNILRQNFNFSRELKKEKLEIISNNFLKIIWNDLLIHKGQSLLLLLIKKNQEIKILINIK